jgi:solute carrier family 8 (sodium/calcium exchanger)
LETTKFNFCQSFSYLTKRTNLPDTDFTIGQRIGRGILYALILLYLFVGISIVSDRFMESIEMITSQEKEVVYKDKASGKKQVKIFNRNLLSLNSHF